jgi:hypothetical protein
MPLSTSLTIYPPIDESLSIAAIVIGVFVLVVAVLFLTFSRRKRGRPTRR